MKRRRSLFIRIGQFRLIVRRVVIVILFFAALALMGLSHSDSPVAEKISNSVSGFFSPVVKVVQYPFEIIYNGYESVADIFRVYRQNKQLKAENKEVVRLKIRLNELENENKNLIKMLNYTPPSSATFVTAKIIAEEGDGFAQSLIVYIGDTDCVRPGQVVLGDKGVIGRIESAENAYARVILLTDINSKIPVMTEQNRIRGILSGDNTPTPKLIFTTTDASIKVGDMLVTSGIAGTFPSDLPIGKVRRFHDNVIEIELLNDMEQLEYVKIVDYGLQATSVKKEY